MLGNTGQVEKQELIESMGLVLTACEGTSGLLQNRSLIRHIWGVSHRVLQETKAGPTFLSFKLKLRRQNLEVTAMC